MGSTKSDDITALDSLSLLGNSPADVRIHDFRHFPANSPKPYYHYMHCVSMYKVFKVIPVNKACIAYCRT